MPSHRRSLTAAFAFAAILLVPDAAKAAYTVSYSGSSGLLIQGDAGTEGANVGLSAEGVYVVSSGTELISPLRIPAATLVRGPGCTQPEPRRVLCPATGNRVITGSLGAGSDWLDGSRTAGDMFVDGGTGGDVLGGGGGFDAIDGGPGDDFLHGGAGNDVVEGGDGKDSFSADGPSADPGADILRGEGGDDTFNADRTAIRADRIEGGPGEDTANYSRRQARVSLKVSYGGPRVADDGQSGEGDDIGGDVEVLIGGSASDSIVATRVAGGQAPSLLRLAGNAGNDRLMSDTDIETDFDPGIGQDAVQGSSANDRVQGRDAEHDDVDCNGGLDAFNADLRDGPLSSECEQVDQGAVKEGPNVVVPSKALRVGRGGAVSVRLRCPRKLKIACAGRLAVRLDRKGARFGAPMRYRLRHGRSVTLRVVLPRAQRARARRSGARLRLRSVERGSHGPKTTLRSVAVRR